MTINGQEVWIVLQNPNFLAQLTLEGMTLTMGNYINHVCVASQHPRPTIPSSSSCPRSQYASTLEPLTPFQPPQQHEVTVLTPILQSCQSSDEPSYLLSMETNPTTQSDPSRYPQPTTPSQRVRKR